MMKWFFRSLNLLVAVIAVFLLYQHFQKPQPPPPEHNEQLADYPAAVPAPVIKLIESFQPLEGKYSAERIAMALDKIDDAALREVLQGLLWDSAAGQELAGLLVERKLVARDNVKALDTAAFKDLAGIRECFRDPRCFPVLEKCLLTLKCCILRCHCWPICKSCDICKACSCYPCCWNSCSDTIQIGPESVSGNYFSVKKIRFVGPGVTVSKDPADASIGVVTITAATPANGSITTAMLADGAVTAAKLADSYAANGHNHLGDPAITNIVTALNNLANNLSSHATNTNNPHAVSKDQVGLANVANVAILDGGGKIDDSLLALRYAPEIHNHDAAYKHANLTILDGLTQAKLDHDTATNNPHNVTKGQVGLGNVTNDAQIRLSEKGVANGVATLDANSNLVFDGGSAKIYGNGANSLSYSFDGTCRQVTTNGISGVCAP